MIFHLKYYICRVGQYIMFPIILVCTRDPILCAYWSGYMDECKFKYISERNRRKYNTPYSIEKDELKKILHDK